MSRFAAMIVSGAPAAANEEVTSPNDVFDFEPENIDSDDEDNVVVTTATPAAAAQPTTAPGAPSQRRHRFGSLSVRGLDMSSPPSESISHGAPVSSPFQPAPLRRRFAALLETDPLAAPSRAVAGVTSSSSCFSASRESGRAVNAHWRGTVGRLNLLTHDTETPCIPLAAAQRGLEMLSMARQAQALIARLSETDFDDVALEQCRIVNATVDCIGNQDFTLASHGSHSGAGFVEKIVPSEAHAALLRTKDSEIHARLETVRQFISTAPKVIEALKFLNRSAQQYSEIEQQAKSFMYPANSEDLELLLRSRGLTPEFGVRLPTFPGAETICTICRNAGVSCNFVQILKNRCTEHAACRMRVNDNTHESCGCTASNLMHYECLRESMFHEFRGSTNEGVGRRFARCPACRGQFCFNDIVCISVERTGAQAAESSQPSSTPTEPVTKARKRKVSSSPAAAESTAE